MSRSFARKSITTCPREKVNERNPFSFRGFLGAQSINSRRCRVIVLGCRLRRHLRLTHLERTGQCTGRDAHPRHALWAHYYGFRIWLERVAASCASAPTGAALATNSAAAGASASRSGRKRPSTINPPPLRGSQMRNILRCLASAGRTGGGRSASSNSSRYGRSRSRRSNSSSMTQWTCASRRSKPLLPAKLQRAGLSASCEAGSIYVSI